MQEQNSAKREAESNIMLQKLIRLDCKDSNFHFKDDFRRVYFKVAYPHTNIDATSNDGLLRQFWHHIQAYYFKRIENQEMKRLQFLKILFSTSQQKENNKNSQNMMSMQFDSEFWEDLNQTFHPSYLQSQIMQKKMQKDDENWIKWLYINWKSVEPSHIFTYGKKKKSKLIYSKLKQNRRHRQHQKNKKLYQKYLKEEEKDIEEYLSDLKETQLENQNEIDAEIRRLEQEMADISMENERIVDELDWKVSQQLDEFKQRKMKISKGSKNGKEKDIREIDLSQQLECIQFLTKSLEEKQVAESVSKITSTERQNGEIKFQITFQKAMNIEPKLITEKELNRINFLRETSLTTYYRSGAKSLYQYICHNYVGFRELLQSRTNLSKMKDKCMIQMMKKGACLASVHEIQHQMNRFNTCHHCKYLYPQYLLVTCKFASDKQAIPKINMEAASDPNIAELNDGFNRNRTSQRFMTRKKNCLTAYAKIHDEYVCGRKYCFTCIKDNYSNDFLRDSGSSFCPFCEGNCTCTRCLRTQKIIKFKNMYTLLGGDFNKIQSESNLEQLQVKNDELMPRGRGRPKKIFTNTHITINKAKKKLKRLSSKEHILKSLHLPPNVFKKKNSFGQFRRLKHSLSNLKSQIKVDSDDTAVKVKRKRGRPSLKSKFQNLARV